MKIIEVVQGSDEWLSLRARHHAASDAPVMMDASSKASRADLVRIKAGGSEREFSDWVRANLLEKGHEIEAQARPLAEQILGEDLFPITATDDDGYLLASFDGLTMAGDVGWECKSWNEDKAAAVRQGCVPDDDYWQVVQQLAVSGARRWLYMVTDGTPEKTVWTYADLQVSDFDALMSAWRQFDADVAAYKHVEVLPPPAAAEIIALPALTLQIEGRVVTSNLAAFRAAADDFIGRIKTDLKTDEDFATAEKMVKACREAEDRLELVKKQALAQTASIDEVFRTIDGIRDLLKGKRLNLDKSVSARKEAIRFEIIEEGRAALAEHIAELNRAIGKTYMPTIPADFAAAMKGKKTVASLRDAMTTELSRAKQVASDTANRIQINLNSLRELAADYVFLFADTAQIVLKANDDLVALVKSRIADHLAAEEAKAEAARKAEAERAAAAEAVAAARRVETAAQGFIGEQESPEAKTATRPATVTAAPSQEGAGPAAAAARPPAGIGRPTDDQIIAALALHFRVHESKVIEWLLDVDLNAAGERMAREFA